MTLTSEGGRIAPAPQTTVYTDFKSKMIPFKRKAMGLFKAPSMPGIDEEPGEIGTESLASTHTATQEDVVPQDDDIVEDSQQGVEYPPTTGTLSGGKTNGMSRLATRICKKQHQHRTQVIQIAPNKNSLSAFTVGMITSPKTAIASSSAMRRPNGTS